MTTGQEYLDQLQAMQQAYPQIAADLIAKGWQVVWATQHGIKEDGSPDWRPLRGTTGGSAAFPVNKDMPKALARIAFRPPPSVKVLDVDHYAEKLGWHTIERAEDELGQLPATWKVSARGAHDHSGRYLYRYEGTDFTDNALRAFADEDTGATCVEVVRTGHRFSWAPGDCNPRTGTLVTCYGPDERPCAMPAVDDLPWMPDEWQRYLADPPRIATPQPVTNLDMDKPRWWEAIPNNTLGTRGELQDLSFQMLLAGAETETIIDEMLRVSVALDLSRPWTRASVEGLVDANSQGKVAAIHAEWAGLRAVVAAHAPGGDAALDLAQKQASREYELARQLAASPNRAMVVSQAMHPETAAVAAGDLPEGYFTSKEFSVDTVLKTVIAGDHPFEPEDTDDQTLAESVLDRMQGARYCADSGQWVVWGERKWAEMPGDLLSWVIAHLARNMPYGNSKPDDEDPEGPRLRRQFKNRAYLRSTSGARAVASKAQALLMMPGQHPLAINRQDIDSDPWVIWGGGHCWDIRASVHGIVEAREAFGQPHLMTAECAPQEMEIPGFWMLLNAILPEQSSRDFWMDLVCRGMLGIPTKRTIPLAVGDTGMGKTLLLERLPLGTYLAPVSGQDLLGGGDREEARRLYVLVGRRMPYIDEGIGTGKYTLGRLKKITSGGSRLPARGIFGKEFEFEPSHTLMMLVNEGEEPPYTDDAVHQRICRVHFNGDRDQIKAIARFYEPGSDMWERETPGVLAFMIRRCAQILAEGSDRGTSFAKPELVQVDQARMAGEQDLVLDWLTQCTDPIPDTDKSRYTDAGILYEHFVAWASRRRESIPSKIAFGLKLTKYKVDAYRPGGRNLRGVVVKQAWANVA